MSFAEIDRSTRVDHQALIARLDRLEAASDAVARGVLERAALESALADLRRVVRTHLLWEDAQLSDIPSDAPAPSAERIARLLASHGELSAVLEFCIGDCAHVEHPRLLARRVRDLAALLRSEIRKEERASARAVALGDPVVAVDSMASGNEIDDAAPRVPRGGPSMIEHLSRPFRPVELTAGTLASFQLQDLAAELRAEEEYRRVGVSAVTLTRDEHLTLVLVALRNGDTMREHRAPSAGTVVLLSGRVRFIAGSDAERAELTPGSLAAFAADLPHAVEALEDAVYLLTIGGRTRGGAPS